MKIKFIILFLIVLVPKAFADQGYTIIGVAYGENDKLVYVEKQKINIKGGKINTSQGQYMTATGALIATFDLDYSYFPRIPLYKFKDYRFDKEEGIYISEGQIIKYRIEEQKVERKDFKTQKDVVVGQGLNFFIIGWIKDLYQIPGLCLHVNFIMPAVDRVYSFRIRKIKGLKDSESKDDIITVRIDSDNMFTRMFTPHIEADFDVSKGRLVEYRGPSDLLNDDGEPQDVQIQYQYPVIEKPFKLKRVNP